MSNLRWILLFAGFAILLLLYFSGRPRKESAYDGQGQRDPDDLENHLGRNNAGLMPAGATELPHTGYQGGFHDNAYQNDPLLEAGNLSHSAPESATEMGQQYVGQAGPHYRESADGFGDMDPADMVRPGGGYSGNPIGNPLASGVPSDALHYTGPDGHFGSAADPAADLAANTQVSTQVSSQGHYADDPAYQVPVTAGDYGDLAVVEAPAPPPPTTLGGKLDAFSARFTSRRKKPAATDKGNTGDESDNPMVILLHVAAPEGQMIDGQLLLQVFEQRRYHFGEKNIFHSLHQGKTVFSIAKMVEPGFFDVNDINSFETPGLLLILQLPGPVAGEAAFEVLISEARELSDALGCRVLDSKRSTLSRQTTQHLRESVSNYVHRQKYFKKANAS